MMSVPLAPLPRREGCRAVGQAVVKDGLDRYTLDEPARHLLRGSYPVHLSPKAFDLLLLLARRRPAAVSKAEIHHCLWPDTFVSDVNLAVLIAEVRAALGEDARNGTSVRTVHRFGYALLGTLKVVERTRERPVASSIYAIEWDGDRTPLSRGENLIGRDAGADVRIDALGVSRRHAVIVVHEDVVTIRDLSSKNGTFVDDVQVRSVVVLTKEADIRLGPVRIGFRRWSADSSTATYDASQG